MTVKQVDSVLKKRGYDQNRRSPEGIHVDIKHNIISFWYLTKKAVDICFDPQMPISKDLDIKHFIRYLDNFTEVVGFIIKCEGEKER